MKQIVISKILYRRFILGRQGLWPGRRWAVKAGAAEALRYVEAVQIDPVSVIAQSHDIVLWGRILDYQPQFLRELAYTDRQFFDYGGALFFYPMDELPYWRVPMERIKRNGRWSDFMRANRQLLEQVRGELRERGPLRNRDFTGNQVNAYRSGKDTGLALYAMWLTGELMTHGRHGKERIYDFAENIVPAHLQTTASTSAAETYFISKALAQEGMVDKRTFRAILKNVRGQPVSAAEAGTKLDELIAAGEIEPIRIEGLKESYTFLAADKPLLEALAAGQTPSSWRPLGPTTAEEVTFLSPLEYVSARRRALKLFDFDYIWEIYKPVERRVFGPYTLPVLYGDRLVARMDARLDRPNKTLVVNGLWLEEWFEAGAAFAAAFNNGLDRFRDFLGAERIDGSAAGTDIIRSHCSQR